MPFSLITTFAVVVETLNDGHNAVWIPYCHRNNHYESRWRMQSKVSRNLWNVSLLVLAMPLSTWWPILVQKSGLYMIDLVWIMLTVVCVYFNKKFIVFFDKKLLILCRFLKTEPMVLILTETALLTITVLIKGMNYKMMPILHLYETPRHPILLFPSDQTSQGDLQNYSHKYWHLLPQQRNTGLKYANKETLACMKMPQKPDVLQLYKRKQTKYWFFGLCHKNVCRLLQVFKGNVKLWQFFSVIKN